MEDHRHLINNRFLVDRQVSGVKDMVTGTEHHLEPRLMAVLIVLLKHSGKLVTREALIQEIWNNYAGAEEGLTQAISSLRKVLADDSKNLIQTIPKKGYVLMAQAVQQNRVDTTPSKARPKMLFIAATGAAVVLLALLLSYNYGGGTVPGSSVEENSTEVAFPGTEKADDTNYLNTITTTDAAGNKYRLTMIGDRRPEFYINDTLQPDTEGYTGLVDKLAKELWRRQGEAEKAIRDAER